VQKRDVTDQRFSHFGECEPPGRLFPVLVDDEVSVFFVYLGGSRNRARVEEFLERYSLGFVNFVPREPSLQNDAG